jgi:hypothetical protein
VGDLYNSNPVVDPSLESNLVLVLTLPLDPRDILASKVLLFPNGNLCRYASASTAPCCWTPRGPRSEPACSTTVGRGAQLDLRVSHAHRTYLLWELPKTWEMQHTVFGSGQNVGGANSFGRCQSLGGAKTWEVPKLWSCQYLGVAKTWELPKLGSCQSLGAAKTWELPQNSKWKVSFVFPPRLHLYEILIPWWTLRRGEPVQLHKDEVGLCTLESS